MRNFIENFAPFVSPSLAVFLKVVCAIFFCVTSQYLIEGECTEQDVQKWSSEEVSSWLRKQGFNEEADIFHG